MFKDDEIKNVLMIIYIFCFSLVLTLGFFSIYKVIGYNIPIFDLSVFGIVISLITIYLIKNKNTIIKKIRDSIEYS